MFRRSDNLCRTSSCTAKEVAEEDESEDVDDDENDEVEVEEKEVGGVVIWEGPPVRATPDIAAVAVDASSPDAVPPVVLPPPPPDWCALDPGTTVEKTEVNEVDDDEGEKEGGDF